MLYIRGHGTTHSPTCWIPASEYVEEAFESFRNTPKTQENTPVYVRVQTGSSELELEFVYGTLGICYMTCGNDIYRLTREYSVSYFTRFGN